MENSEKIEMDINIGGQEISLSVPADRKERVANLEREMNSLFKTWRNTFPRKTEKELIAMIAYQYASYYQELTERYLEAAKIAAECDDSLGKINF